MPAIPPPEKTYRIIKVTPDGTVTEVKRTARRGGAFQTRSYHQNTLNEQRLQWQQSQDPNCRAWYAYRWRNAPEPEQAEFFVEEADLSPWRRVQK